MGDGKASEGGKGEGGDKLRPGLGEDRTDGYAPPAQQADKLQTFVGRNSAAHDQ